MTASTHVTELCQKVFGTVPDAVLRPGGVSRQTILLQVGAARYALAKRSSPARAALEAGALRYLSGTGHTPSLVHHEGCFVIQTYVEGKRLSAVLDRAAPDEVDHWITSAAQSLATLQEAAAQSPLRAQLPHIGARDGWAADLAQVPARLAQRLGIDLDFDVAQATRRLAVPRPQPVKWDARPGNAIVTPDGRVVWFDWEHCGLRRATDDLAWFLADEWCPHRPDLEPALIARFAAADPEAFTTMALLHAFVRVDLILSRRAGGPWWDRETCLAQDKIGVTANELARQLAKIKAWGARSKSAYGLNQFCDAIAERI
ncbi:aminoglycoside phosphotransferase family protein [Tropicibacter naphthalenivorans]|nr:aminoglycoside phosphotransferase family protein [Tropicibacter naphthalenivorans]